MTSVEGDPDHTENWIAISPGVGWFRPMPPSGHRKRLASTALALAFALLLPVDAAGKSTSRASGRSTRQAQGASRPREAVPPRQASPALQKARAELAAVKKSPARRRYRHNWEKAISARERPARGPDTAPALPDAARARDALYRFSAVESDREAALRLAARASKAGASQGASLAAAIRREAGDEPAPVAKGTRRSPTPSGAPPARRADPPPAAPPSAPSPAAEDEDPPDPVLEEAVSETQPAPPPEKGPSAPAA